VVKRVASKTFPMPKQAKAQEDTTLITPSSFPIVAVGASAGGLEALEQFLSHVP